MSAHVIASPSANGSERSSASAPPAVALRDVRKVYGKGDSEVVALNGVSIGLESGSFTAIMGPSGSGKSTFLHVAAGLDQPTSGAALLGDVDLARLSERRRTILRRERIGFVFQAFNLMPSLTVTQNIGLPLRLDGRRPRRSEVREVAARVGLAERLRHRPAQLSGGHSSASRSRGRSSLGQRSCSPTSPPERSTPVPDAASSHCCGTSSTPTDTPS
jgi:predicted ABC-type transport system involved in lysophospholipase L1 biosynthesis ATPase subunit